MGRATGAGVMSDTHDRARDIAEEIVGSWADPPSDRIEREHRDRLVSAIASALLAERRDAIEEAARVVDERVSVWGAPEDREPQKKIAAVVTGVCENIAIAIRALSGQPADDGTSHE